MATTTHNLKIKAVLDTSEIRSQLNRIRESSPVGGGLNSSLDLNNAISRLIQALDKLPSNITREQKQSGVAQNFNARAFAGFAVGYGINKIGNSFSELLEAKGYSKTDVVKSALTNIGTGAVAGAAFGPAGAALGAAFGIATAAIDSWADSVKKSQDELEKWNSIIKEAQKTQQKESSYLTERNSREFLSQAVKRLDIDSLMQARQSAYQKNLSARELMGKDLPAMLEEKKALEQRIKDIDDRRQRTTYTQSTYGVQAQTVGDLSDREADAQIEQVKKQMSQLEENIKRRNSALEVAQATDREIAEIDAAIAQIEADKKQVAEQALKAQEDELKAIQKAQEEAKKRVELMTSLNQAISDQLESYNITKENKRIKELIGSGDIKAIADEKKKQDKIAKDSESNYKSLLEQAQQATTPEGKEFFLEQANEEKKIWQQAESAADSLGITLDQFQDAVAREVKNRKELLDKSKQSLTDIIKQNTNQYYKAGISVGEFGKAGIQGGAQPTLGSSNLVGVRESAADIRAKGGGMLFGTKDSRRLFGTNEVASDIVARNAEEKIGEAEQSYEVGYDVGQDKTEKVIDIAEVIKDLLAEMKQQQKIQTEIQRESIKQGLL